MGFLGVPLDKWGVGEGLGGFGGVFERNKAAGGKLVKKHEFLIKKCENTGHSACFLWVYGVIWGV